jgi:uncharacterized membrane protein (DUF485 family)
MIPFAVAFKYLLDQEKISGVTFGTVALIEILTFIATLVVGYIYVWKKGTFDWGLQARSEARAEARVLSNKKKQRVAAMKRAA